MKYMDKKNRRLVFIKINTDSDYWDEHWNINSINVDAVIRKQHTMVSYITKKYFEPKEGLILEGGCGKGQNVASLRFNGYEVIGVDYAKKTVEQLNKYAPEMNIYLADVRDLSFPDSYFGAYWSIGLIEHFFGGYDELADEMNRVLKPGGILFISFPCMSWIRIIKSRLNLYKEWNSEMKTNNFYQFAFDVKSVEQNFEKKGFRLVARHKTGGFKGLKDEVSIGRRTLQFIYDNQSQNKILRLMYLAASVILNPLTNHSIILVFKKVKRI